MRMCARPTSSPLVGPRVRGQLTRVRARNIHARRTKSGNATCAGVDRLCRRTRCSAQRADPDALLSLVFQVAAEYDKHEVLSPLPLLPSAHSIVTLTRCTCRIESYHILLYCICVIPCYCIVSQRVVSIVSCRIRFYSHAFGNTSPSGVCKVYVKARWASTRDRS